MILLYFGIFSFHLAHSNNINKKNTLNLLNTLSSELNNDYSLPGAFASMEKMSHDKGSLSREPAERNVEKREEPYPFNTYGPARIPFTAVKLKVTKPKIHRQRKKHRQKMVYQCQPQCAPQCEPECVATTGGERYNMMNNQVRRSISPIYPIHRMVPRYMRNPFVNFRRV
ncbi:hypothetical protein SNEBB_007809 [Seison nebaliae]|nr:hypothetical protein SNEBB_007809 [Seison nebaliae]